MAQNVHVSDNLRCSLKGYEMSDREVRLKLSPRAHDEWQQVADWVGKPLATVIAQHLEEHHRSSEFQQLMERVKRNADESQG